VEMVALLPQLLIFHLPLLCYYTKALLRYIVLVAKVFLYCLVAALPVD